MPASPTDGICHLTQEDGSGLFVLEDSSGDLILEVCDEVAVTPVPVAADAGGAGFVSGTGAFHPDKYYRAFHRFLGIARRKHRKKEIRELVKLERIARDFVEEFKPSDISGSEAVRGLLPILLPPEPTQEERRAATIKAMLDEALAKYERLARERKEQDEADEEEAVILLLMH